MSNTPKHIVIDARIRRSSTGRYVDRLIAHLQQIDTTNRYTILLQPDDPLEPTAKNFSKVPCPYPQFSFNPIHDVRFTRLLKSLKPDLVHFSMSQQPVSYFGNIVTTTHDLTMIRFTKPGKNPLIIFWLKAFGYRFLLKWSHKKSRKIIVPTNYVRNDLANYQPFTKSKIITIYEASEEANLSELSRPADIPEGQTKFVLYVGNAFPHKNPERLVEAFKKIHDADSEVRLYFVGKKEFYYNELEKYIVRTGATEFIHILGFVSDAELAWLYKNASCYVFPSLSEGFGLPGLEAMAHGCPVVSSDATCLPEVYGDAAHYFSPEDVDDMARAISEVLESKPLQKELVSKGYEQLKKYSWQKMAQETRKVYNECIENA
jgi:glycosyltransferase involved in cell wall biosynthesis